MENTHILIFILIALAVVAVAAGSWWIAKKRREAFKRLAKKLGLRYQRRDYTFDDRYVFLHDLDKGSNRYAYNILEGGFEGHFVRAFDYHYETYSRDSKGRRRTHHHRFSYFVLEHEELFPELRIYPETWLSKVGQMVGFDDIDFESIEFSKAFTVRSKDKRFAYDICHGRMMEYLLDHPDVSLEIDRHCLAMGFDKTLKVDEIEGRLRQLCAIRELFPEYLYAK